jgi:hypothetical protein
MSVTVEGEVSRLLANDSVVNEDLHRIKLASLSTHNAEKNDAGRTLSLLLLRSLRDMGGRTTSRE